MMKMRHILYISLVLLIAGCTNEENFSDTLSGNGKKTPLLINATLDTGKGLTRASGNKFVSGDELLTYVRHVKSGDAINNYSYVSDDPGIYNKLVTYTKGNAAMGGAENDVTRETSDLTSAAYWDDFSTSTHYLRDEGHGLQSYYGYCYNGRSEAPAPSLTESSGNLVWSVLQNQSTAEAVQHSDLLWSPTQEKVTYVHSTAYKGDGINHGTLVLPFTHAMSQITVKVIADNSPTDGGFTTGSKPLQSSSIKLNAMYTQVTLTAPNSTWGSSTESATITMHPNDPYPDNNEFQREFVAIVAPGTKLKVDERLLTLEDVHGNNYTDTITTTMIDNSHWGSGHTIYTDTDTKKYILTQPGKNYRLELTVKKSAIQAKSTLADWTSVDASSDGKIFFPDDVDLIMDDGYYPGNDEVNVMTIDKNKFENGASFSLFRLREADAESNTNGEYSFSSISTFQDNADPADDKWINDPELFWLNSTDKYYYRALAKFNTPADVKNDINNVGTDKATAVAVSQGTIAVDHDILYGTTARHFGYGTNLTYPRGAAIPPRTKGVPIIFEHALSKISFTLTTTNDETVENTNAKVDLTGATIAISNIYTSATITLHNGEMDFTGKNKVDNAIPATTSISEYIVIPQTFGDNAVVTITLPNQNGAIYKIPLKDCVVDSTTPITAWERGKKYSYTIHVEKEKIKFNALVKDWDVVNGSGDAALEW